MNALLTARLHRTLLAWGLACALLAAQVLGLLHGVVHLPAGGESAHPVASQIHATARTDGLAGLFPGHADASGCRLFDAIGHGGLAAAPAPALPALALALFLSLLPPATCPAPPAAAFEARGPPSQT